MLKTRGAKSALLLMLLGVCWSRPASAQFFIEPELGLTGTTANWSSVTIPAPFGFAASFDGPILGPGVAVGGNMGFHLSPMIALVGSIRIGIHGKPDKTDLKLFDLVSDTVYTARLDVVESGVSLELLAGARIYPMGGDENSAIQPYIGAGVGVGSIGWTYDTTNFSGGLVSNETADAVGGLMAAGEGGLDFRASKMVSLGLSGRVALHSWSKESVERLNTSGMSGVSWGLTGRLGLHF